MVWRVAVALGIVLALLPLATPGYAAESIVDNSDGSIQIKGTWTSTRETPGFYGADYLFHTPGDGTASVTWPFPSSSPAAHYTVYAQWSAGPNRASNATYQINSNSGNTSVSVNQKINGGGWQQLGSFDFQPKKGQGVTLTDRADGVVVADAIRFVSGTDPLPQMAAAAPAPAPATPQPAPAAGPVVANDARYFAQTGYRVAEDAFWKYFLSRGGLGSFGYPVSNEFQLYGMQVQIFQRQLMQLRPDGGVQTMNILDEGLLPYTHMNGSTFPAPDPSVISQSPKPSDPDYLAKAMDFVRATAPDSFDGEPVNFSKTFFSSVTVHDAFPDGPPADGSD